MQYKLWSVLGQSDLGLHYFQMPFCRKLVYKILGDLPNLNIILAIKNISPINLCGIFIYPKYLDR